VKILMQCGLSALTDHEHFKKQYCIARVQQNNKHPEIGPEPGVFRVICPSMLGKVFLIFLFWMPLLPVVISPLRSSWQHLI